MNLSDHNYNHYLKRWKSQFRIYADLMDCTIALVTEIKPGTLTTIAYNSPHQNSIFFNKNIDNSICKEIISNTQRIFIDNLQQSKYNHSLEGEAGLRCFYGIPVKNEDNIAFAALCIYSKKQNLLENEKTDQLDKIKLQIEEDIYIAAQETNHKHTSDIEFSEDDKIKQIFKYSPIGLFYFDTNLIITDFNDRFVEILRSSREVLLGLNINNITDKRVLPPIQSAILGIEDEYEGEYNTSSSNACISIHLKTAPVYKNNKVIGGIGITQDISVRTNIAKALQSSENKYRDLVEKINDVIFSIDTNGVCTYVSPIIKLLIGHTPKEIIGYHFIKLIHPDHKITFEGALKKVSLGTTVVSELKIRNKNGSYRWIRSSMRPIYGEDGLFIGIHGVAQDIEEARTAELSLRESEKQFRLVATHISDIIFEWNLENDDLIWYGNPAIISPELSPIKKFSELNSLVEPDDRVKLMSLWQKAKDNKEAWKEELKIFPSNSTEPIHILGSGLILFKNNKPYKGFGTLTNVTNEKKLVQNLKHSNERLAQHISKTNGLLTAIPDMMFSFDKSGYITEYHSNDRKELYREDSEFINKNVLDILPKDIGIMTMDKITRVLSTKQVDTYKYQLEIGGEIQTYESRMVYLNSTHTLAIVRNITESELAKEELIAAKERAEESDRLKSSFLANMSHEIRTPMNGIIGFSELLNSRTINPEEREYYTSVIVKSGHQLLEIINDVLEISKIETGQIQVNNSSVRILDVFNILHSFFSNKAQDNNNELIIDPLIVDSDITFITDEGKFKQILNNLLSNAIKFTKNGTIKYGFSIIDDRFIEFYVQDTGIGISKKEQDKIFERFTQANPKIMRQHGGTGLGLSISQSLVEILGGKIWVDSEIDKGAKFSFSLPYKKPQ